MKVLLATCIIMVSLVSAYGQSRDFGTAPRLDPGGTYDQFGGGYVISTAPRFRSDGSFVSRSTTTVKPDGFGGYSISTAPRFGSDGFYIPRSTTTIRPNSISGY